MGQNWTPWPEGGGAGPPGLREEGLGAGPPGPREAGRDRTRSGARGLSAAPCRTVWRRHRVLLLVAALPTASQRAGLGADGLHGSAAHLVGGDSPGSPCPERLLALRLLQPRLPRPSHLRHRALQLALGRGACLGPGTLRDPRPWSPPLPEPPRPAFPSAGLSRMVSSLLRVLPAPLTPDHHLPMCRLCHWPPLPAAHPSPVSDSPAPRPPGPWRGGAVGGAPSPIGLSLAPGSLSLCLNCSKILKCFMTGSRPRIKMGDVFLLRLSLVGRVRY